MTDRRIPVGPPVAYLWEREPWAPGPQALQGHQFPVPGSRRAVRPNLSPGALPPLVNPNAPAPFPIPTWGAYAHQYAYCTQQLIAYTTTSGSAASLLAPTTFRNMLALRNLSTTETAQISFGTAANANSTFQLAPGAFAFFDEVVPQDDLYVNGTGAGNLSLTVSTVGLPSIPPPTPPMP